MSVLFAKRTIFRPQKGHGLFIHFFRHFHAGRNRGGCADINPGRHDNVITGIGNKCPGGNRAAPGDKGNGRHRGFQNGIGDIHRGIHPAAIGVYNEQ